MITENARIDLLARLDIERRASGDPSAEGHGWRETSPTGSQCTIIYSHCAADEIDRVIRDEALRARERNYALEWKVYGHDTPTDLKDRLVAAGFAPEPVESLLVLEANETTLANFGAPAYEIKRLRDPDRLDDYAAVCRDVGRTNVGDETNRLAATLRETPDLMSVYVAYVAGEAVGCGRIYFLPDSEFAGIYGGNTKKAHRNRGIYTALVAARLREAMARNRRYILVDALPTSEPILKKRGFEFVTHTQPFVYGPGS